MRKYFDIGPFDAFEVELDGVRYTYSSTTLFAEIADLPANIHQEVRVNKAGRAFLVTIVSDKESDDANGVTKGWYSARWITEAEAWKVRESWNVLRPQDPLMPGTNIPTP